MYFYYWYFNYMKLIILLYFYCWYYNKYSIIDELVEVSQL